jgi:hypothetical protein
MPELSTHAAAARLAEVVEKSKANALGEIYAELFPEKCSPSSPDANDMARHIRNGLEAEEIVDLWNVVFPEDRNVWYDDESKAIHFNEEMSWDAD